MRNLFIIGMLVVAASMAGWFSINREGDNVNIEFNRGEIRDDLGKIANKGRDYLDRIEANRSSGDGQYDQNQPSQNQPSQNQYADRQYDNGQARGQNDYRYDQRDNRQDRWADSRDAGQPNYDSRNNDPRYRDSNAYPPSSQPNQQSYDQAGRYQDNQQYNNNSGYQSGQSY